MSSLLFGSLRVVLTLHTSTIHNQDDCLAINKGSNIVFQRNTCIGGHGISIGSISSDATVSGITISGNTITNKFVFTQWSVAGKSD